MRERVLNYYIYEMNNLQIRNKSAELNLPSPPLEKGGNGGFLKKVGNGGFLSEMVKKGCFNENEFRETILLCRLQRHMQALGAYGFLATVKGKKYFLKHVIEGLRLLKEDVSFSKDEYPELYELVMGF